MTQKKKVWDSCLIIILTILLVVSPVLAEGIQTEALSFLEYQANGQFEDDDVINIIVEINDNNKMVYGGSKKPSSISALRTEKGILNQMKYAEISQDVVLREIIKDDINVEKLQSYAIIMNGFSLKTTYGEAKKIASMPQVKKVYIDALYSQPEVPLMESSKGIVNTGSAWDLGYKGEGMLVSVIDSGTDPQHKDFRISEGVKVKYTKEEMEKKIAELGLPGKWFNEKVPFGYNYYSDNVIIKEQGAKSLNMVCMLQGLL